jgi:hypothetical protein
VKRTWLPSTLIACGIGVALGCRSDLETPAKKSARSSAAAPAAEPAATDAPPAATHAATPIEVQDGFATARKYYQSRSVMTFDLDKNLAEAGDQLSLVNDSTGQSLIDSIPLAAGLTDLGDSVAPLTDAAFEIRIRLYPSAPSSAGRFAYGANVLRLLINDRVAPRFAKSAIFLRDFPFQGPRLALLADGVEGRAGFDADASTVVAPIVTNGTATLTSGFVPILSR